MNLTKSIPAVVVPDLVLPYTEEECAPLPPKEYPVSNEDIEDVSHAEGEDGAGGKKVDSDIGEENMAEDTGNAAMNVDTNAEADVHAEDVAQV